MGMHAPVAEQVRQSGTGPERWKDGKTKDGNFFFSDLTLNIVGPSLLPFGVSEGVMTASCSLGSQSQDMLCIQGDVKLSLRGYLSIDRPGSRNINAYSSGPPFSYRENYYPIAPVHPADPKQSFPDNR